MAKEKRIKSKTKPGKGEPGFDAHVHPSVDNSLCSLAGDVPIRVRTQASITGEEALREIKGNLEILVTERTAELEEINRALEEQIAELKTAKEAAKAERKRFHDVLETLPVYVVLLTPDYHVPFANRVFRELFGESHGRCCFEYLFGRTEPCKICETWSVLKTMKPHRWEWTGPNGHNYNVYDFPFTDTDGSTMILEMGMDITDRKRAEKELQTAISYNRELIEVSLDPLVTIGSDGKITDVNAATEAVTGRNRGELIGTDFADYFTQPGKARAGYEQVFREGLVRDYALEIRHHNGHITPVLYNAAVYRNDVGNVIGVFAAARDVTERKRAEKELHRYREHLEELVRQRTSELEDRNARLADEITERKRHENRITSLTRLYQVLSHVNEAIVRIRDEGSLFAEVCRIVAEEGKFSLVWIGMVKGQQVVPVASCGEEVDYLKEIKVEIEGELGMGPTGTCIRENRPVVNNDFATNPAALPWREPALRHGFHSSAAFPLRRQGKVGGVFTLYAFEPDAFDAEQVSLLESLSADISYALDALDQEQLRTRTEEELIQAKEEWERTFASVPDMVTILDNRYRVLRVNAAMARRLGVKAEECAGLPCYEAVHGLSEPPPFCPHSRTIEDGRQHIVEVHEDRLGGDFEVSTTPMYDGRGKVIGSVHVAHDITERRRAENTIRHSLSRFELLAETAGTLLQASDPQGALESLALKAMEFLDCHVFFNYLTDEGAGRLRLNVCAGIPDEEVMKIGWLDYGVAVCGCAALDACRIVAEHIPTTPDVRTELVKSYGVKAYACHPLMGPGEKVIGTLSFGTRNRETFSNEDLSLMKALTDQVAMAMVRMKAEKELKKAHEDLEKRIIERTGELQEAYNRLIEGTKERDRLEEQLRHAQKMDAIGTLAGGIAHDFNNIIAGIIGFAEMVLEDVPGDSPVHRRLEFILKGAYRGRDLVKQILTFSRRGEQEKRPVSMSLVIAEVIPLIRAIIPSTIEIRRNILTESDIISADQTQIHQVVLNLCSNAAYAMRDQGGVLEIVLKDEIVTSEDYGAHPELKPGPYTRLTVSDTGCGMEPEILDRIFDPFFTTKASGEGTGLGLSVVHGIIRSHGGAISVYSKPGQGSSFHVIIPKIVSDVALERKEITRTPRGEGQILVVDDEDLLTEMSRQRLERLGYGVVGKTDSIEALEVFRAEPDRFDLVITDYTMPNMTGFDLSKEILHIRPDVPIIMCSGLHEPVPREKIKEIGIRDFFEKPIGNDDFARLIQDVLDKSRHRDIRKDG